MKIIRLMGMIFALMLLSATSLLRAEGMKLGSPAFTDGGKLPAEFTCDGDRTSPPLQWDNAPAGAKSFAITMHHSPGADDTHVYFVLYNIPATTKSIPKNVANVGVFGINTVNQQQEYTPPCSKGPGEKKYTFTVYALSEAPKLSVPAAQVTMQILLDTIKDKTLAKATMNVTYERFGQAVGRGGGNQRTGADDRADQRGGPNDRDGGPPENRGPGHGRVADLENAIDDLGLTADQKAKLEPALKKFLEDEQKLMEEERKKREALVDELLKKITGVIDGKQLEDLADALKNPGPPPPPDGGPGGPGGPDGGPPPGGPR